MKNPFLVLVILLFVGAIASHYAYQFSKKQDYRERLEQAFQEYKRGEVSQTIGEREDAFNRSLSDYLDLENEYHPVYGNGKLYFNIANSFFQLGNYPFAVLYYYRAEKLMPRNEVVRSHLAMALSKLGIKKNRELTVGKRIFFFHFSLSLPEKLQLIFIFLFVAFVLGSAYLWTHISWLKSLAMAFVFIGMIFLASYGYSYYAAPIEAVIVQSVGIYRDAGFQFAKVREKPVLSGNQVEVLEVVGKRNWLKVRTSEGEVGYVPQESIRII